MVASNLASYANLFRSAFNQISHWIRFGLELDWLPLGVFGAIFSPLNATHILINIIWKYFRLPPWRRSHYTTTTTATTAAAPRCEHKAAVPVGFTRVWGIVRRLAVAQNSDFSKPTDHAKSPPPISFYAVAQLRKLLALEKARRRTPCDSKGQKPRVKHWCVNKQFRVFSGTSAR